MGRRTERNVWSAPRRAQTWRRTEFAEIRRRDRDVAAGRGLVIQTAAPEATWFVADDLENVPGFAVRVKV